MIGAALAGHAANAGMEVLCIARKDSARLNNLPESGSMEIAYCDVEGYGDFCVDGRCDAFFHLAWRNTFGDSRDDVDSQSANIQYTMDAIRLAKRLGCKKFIGAGSQAEYGIATEPLTCETPVNPQSGYGVAKYAAGKLGRILCEQLDMEFNWVRILSVYGHLDGANTLISYAIDELQAGRSPAFTKCEQIWDYLYCGDAAKALLAVGEKGVNGKTYPLGSGTGMQLSEYLELLRDIVAPGVALQFGEKEYYPHQPMLLCADISELTRDTGWRPEVSFEDGIRSIVSKKQAGTKR